MPSSHPSVRARLRRFFALDDDWSRTTPPVSRADLAFGAAMEAAGLLMLELFRSIGSSVATPAPWWVQYLAVSLGAVSLVWRRRFPLAVAVFLAAHMFVVGVTMPQVMGQIALQICYFMGLFSAMSWGRSRRAALATAAGIVAFMLLWVLWQFALGTSVQEFYDETRGYRREGVFPPIVAAIAYVFLINVLYFFGATIGGQVAWRAARQRARLREQAETIAAQTDSLRRRAVVDERLRISRELHDVVGHHVSVIGVQAAGARRVLMRDPGAASHALEQIETTSREAVEQMRGLLGTLRSIEEESRESEDIAGGRGPEPGIESLSDLARARTDVGLTTAYRLVEDTPGSSERLPAPLALTIYRVAQESLANVARHSTAQRASVTVRVADRAADPHVELEVLDDGRPKGPSSSGGGLGQVGIRERVASHKGEVEIGPRPTGGYRVRIRIPLGEIDVHRIAS